MSILATKVTALHQPRWRELICGRCGIEHSGNPRSLQADYCQDCRPEARALGWLTTQHREKAAA